MLRALRLVLALSLFLVFLPSLADAGKDRKMSAKHKKTLRALERCDCPGIFAPVCGADGNTWINACEARCRGVRSEAGTCEPPECVGDDASTCEMGLFCETAPGCGSDAPGTCEEPPVACTEEFAPVCGCDGETYGNDCERAAAGVRLDFEGDCDSRPVECRSDETCDEGEFCARPIGVCGSQSGVCSAPVLICTDELDPVCGCDNETYGNGCQATAAGVNIAHEGECELSPPEDCRHDRDCEANEFCRKAEGDCDGKGMCEARPEICPLVLDRVCGCDGETYDNECAAATAGVSLSDDDACEDDDVPVCHRPPGNPGNKHTIYVGESAVSAHLRHGDWRGPCER